MTEAAKQPKKRKVLSEETKKRKREATRIKGQSRINIGPAFSRWRELKDEEGFPTDAALALFLLDYYQKKQVTSAPHKQHLQWLQPIVSSFTEESVHVRAKWLQQDGAESKTTRVEWHQDSYEEIEVTIDGDECNSVKNRLTDFDSDMENIAETTEQSFSGADDSCEEDVSIQRPIKSELLLECKEEELEPSQKHTSQVHIKKEEDDCGEFSTSHQIHEECGVEVSRLSSGDQADCKPEPSSPQCCSAALHTPTPEAYGAVCSSEAHQVSNKPVFLSSDQSHETNIKTEF